MQTASELSPQAPAAPVSVTGATLAPVDVRYAQYMVIRRNGAVVGFEPGKIAIAMTKAFLAVDGSQAAGSARVREQVAQLTASAINALLRRQPHGGTFHIEDIQDQVELSLMRSGLHEVARSYVLYREDRAHSRAESRRGQPAAGAVEPPPPIRVKDGDT
ncbi:MAG: ribonucleoside-diphosphate reductase subunit alpha, partial [Proteobacteria bacterium]|nr:ribonucleoside-diphosphate reductase subunit alpha [Burkholderiales bacterium]